MGQRTGGRKLRLLLATIVSGALLAQNASAAPGDISTVAGGGVGGGPAIANVGPSGVAVDTSGNLFIVDSGSDRVRKVDTSGRITTVAGNGTRGFSGDGGPATSASLYYPFGVAVDTSGNLFIADAYNKRVRKVDASGTITTVAGNGTNGFSGDGGPATSARLFPFGVAVDTSGNLFIADTYNHRARKVDASGTITTVAGDGTSGFSGDGGPPTSARLSYPFGVAVDTSGNLFIADSGNSRIRKVDASGTITTVAGGGECSYVGITGPPGTPVSGIPVGTNPCGAVVGDGGPATSAWLDFPYSVAVDASGNLFIADTYNNRVRKVDAFGLITTVAGISCHVDVTVWSTVGTNPCAARGSLGDGGPATIARLVSPRGVAVDMSGNLFIADWGNSRVRKVDASGTITTIPGDGAYGGFGDGGPATGASLRYPYSVAVDTSGNLFIADAHNHRVRKVDASGTITTVAGNGGEGFAGDGGPATNARLNEPSGVAVDASGNLFIADAWNHRVRKVDASGTITTVAGGGGCSVYTIGVWANPCASGFSGDGGPATNASLSYPRGVAVDTAGNLFIADSWNNRIRKVNAFGLITTVAGAGLTDVSTPSVGPGPCFPIGFGVCVPRLPVVTVSPALGDGGPAVAARLHSPHSVTIDDAGNLFIADTGNYRIRKVDAFGTITTVAGDGTYGFSGDAGPAVAAKLSYPTEVTIDDAGNLFIADAPNNRVRKVDASGMITTVAGNGTDGFFGDGGPATNARLTYPRGVAVDTSGNLFIADTGNSRVRKVAAG